MINVQKEEIEWRRPRIEINDVIRYGLTPGCQGCQASSRGQGARNHTEECRTRMEGYMSRDEDPRISRCNQRIVDASAKYLPKDEGVTVAEDTGNPGSTEPRMESRTPPAGGDMGSRVHSQQELYLKTWTW